MKLDNFNQIVGSGINIYGSREKIRYQLVEFAKQYLELGTVDFYKTSVVSYIIDTLSILSANHLFYDSVIYREFFMVDAQMQESVYNLARWIGYQVPNATPSAVDVMFTFPLSFGSNEVVFSIPNNFKAHAGDIIFSIDAVSPNYPAAEFRLNRERFREEFGSQFPAATGRIINSSVLTVKDSNGFYRPIYINEEGTKASFTLSFTQHERKVLQFLIPEHIQPYQFFSKIMNFEGMISQVKLWVVEPGFGEKFSLDVTKSDNFNPAEQIESYAPGRQGNYYKWEEWGESPHGIYTMAPNSQEFVFVNGINKGELFFGNGIVGKQPAPNSMVTVELYITKGEAGHVIPGSITKGDTLFYTVRPTYDEEGNITESDITSKLHTIDYSILNPVHSQGGINTLTLPEIKRNAIINLRSKQRLVSEMDYDDINVIMGEAFPTVEAYPLLKRSDIKVNEIIAFIRLMYHDENYLPQIVPTRNAKFPIYNPVFNSNGQYTILRTSILNIDDEDFQTLFNITIDSATMMAYYDYILKDIKGSPVILYREVEPSFYQQYSYIPINNVDFDIDLDADDESSSSTSSSTVYSGNATYPLKIQVNLNHIPTSPDSDYQADEFRCRMITKWGGNQEYNQESLTTHVDGDGQTVYDNFEFEISNYLDIPSGVQRFEFHIDAYVILRDAQGNFINSDGEQVEAGDAELGWQPLSRYYADVLVRKDLTPVMQSTVTKTSYWAGQAHPGEWRYNIHDVPMILSSYLDDGSNGGIFNRADNQQYPNFEVTVMQAFIQNLELAKKRMLTDFINIKFPDTYGTLNNLKYNPLDYVVRSRFKTPFNIENPEGIIFVDQGSSSSDWYSPDGITRYIVNGEVASYAAAGRELASYIDYIAEYYPTVSGGTWYLIEPTRGMYVQVEDELDSTDREKVIIYDGDQWKDAQDFYIPIRIKLKVEMDPVTTMTGDKLKQDIKDNLVNYFSPKMGIHKNLDRSEIITIVRETSGVLYCELREPEIDIRFNYEIKDLTQEEIIDYTPQYIGFTEDSIEIEIAQRPV